MSTRTGALETIEVILPSRDAAFGRGLLASLSAFGSLSIDRCAASRFERPLTPRFSVGRYRRMHSVGAKRRQQDDAWHGVVRFGLIAWAMERLR